MAVRVKATKGATKAKSAPEEEADEDVEAVVAQALDFDDVKSGFDPIPAGNYALQVEKVTVGKTSQKKTPQISVVFQVVSGPFKGRKIWDHFIWLENSLWRLKMYCKAAGIEFRGKRQTIDAGAALVEPGTEVKATVIINERENNEIKRYLEPK